MYADDLGRMLGWEFSLMVATMRMINSGLLDELPTLKIQFSHFSGGIGRYLGRIRGFQQRDKWGTAAVPRHGRQPKLPFDHYLEQRLFYDCAGWAGPDHAAEWGARMGALRPAGGGAVADGVCDRLSAGGARSRGGRRPMSRRCARSGRMRAPWSTASAPSG